MSGPPTLKKPNIVIRAEARAVRKFRADLKISIDAAERTAGGYSSFLLLSDGRKLQIEVNP